MKKYLTTNNLITGFAGAALAAIIAIGGFSSNSLLSASGAAGSLVPLSINGAKALIRS